MPSPADFFLSQLPVLASPAGTDYALLLRTSDTSTPPAGSGGSDHISTLASMAPAMGFPFYYVDRYGADPTGSSDSTSAFTSAYAAAAATLSGGAPGAFVLMGAGTYKVNAGSLGAADPRIGLIGPGAAVCRVNAIGSGDVFRHQTPQAMFATRHLGLKIGGFVLDLSGMTGAGAGLHVTDIGPLHYDDLIIQNGASRASTTLSAALTAGTAITSLPVAAIPEAIPAGAKVTIATGSGNAVQFQSFVTSNSVVSGATAIPVNSATPVIAFASGSKVQPRLVGVWCDTQGGWSEKLLLTRVQVSNCDIGVCFDGVTPATGASYDYMRCLDLHTNISPGQIGVLVENFAQLDQPTFFRSWNASPAAGGADAFVLVIGPNNASSEQSRIRNALTDHRGEVDGSGSNVFDIQVGQFAQLRSEGPIVSVGSGGSPVAGNLNGSGVTYVSGLISTPVFGTGQQQFALSGLWGSYGTFPNPVTAKGLAPALASGTVTLVAGTASVTDTRITAASIVRTFNTGAAGTVGPLSVTLHTGTGFTINSTSTDTSKVYWEVVSF